MAIPASKNGLLPPYDGEDAQIDCSSPFPATTLELCQKFGRTPQRREILKGFLRFRALFHQLGVTEGFQWVDGRFLEEDGDAGAGPDYIDVVTFCKDPPLIDEPRFDEISAPLRADFDAIRKDFHVVGVLVSLDWPASEIIKQTGFYGSLYSHQQGTGIWKGMLEIQLATTKEDARAMEHLNTSEGT